MVTAKGGLGFEVKGAKMKKGWIMKINTETQGMQSEGAQHVVNNVKPSEARICNWILTHHHLRRLSQPFR